MEPVESRTSRVSDDLERIARLIEDRDVLTFRSEYRDGIADELATCRDLSELSNFMGEASHSCGFKYFTIFLLRQGRSGAFTRRICTSFPKSWIHRYKEMSYQFIDPVVNAAENLDEPFLFTDLDGCAPAVRSFWDDAERHSVGREGFCAAFDFDDEARIGVSFSTVNFPEKFNEEIRFDMYDALEFARMGAIIFSRLGRKLISPPDALTQTELRVLYSLASANDVEEVLAGFQRSKASKDLEVEIQRKLEVSSILQAAAVASANHWFDHLDYEVSDVALGISSEAD